MWVRGRWVVVLDHLEWSMRLASQTSYPCTAAYLSLPPSMHQPAAIHVRRSVCARVRAHGWCLTGLTGCAGSRDTAAWPAAHRAQYRSPRVRPVQRACSTRAHACRHTHAHTRTCMHDCTGVHKHAQACTCMHTYAHVCTHLRTRMHTHRETDGWTPADTYICDRTWACPYTCAHMCGGPPGRLAPRLLRCEAPADV